jgi:uncharacterized membrane-anchored protein YhcB (DUF1043 family)
LKIDYRQIVFYFQEKLERIEREGRDELERLKKNFHDSYNQKQTVMTNLLIKMDKQRSLLEEMLVEREKIKNQDEEDMKILNMDYNSGKSKILKETPIITSSTINVRESSNPYSNPRVVQ